jgi:hypothetical protein
VERGRRAGATLLTPPIAFTVVVASNPEVFPTSNAPSITTTSSA